MNERGEYIPTSTTGEHRMAAAVRLDEAWAALTNNQRSVLLTMWGKNASRDETVEALLLAMLADRDKAESDKRTSKRRRVLVGAMVPRDFAARCRRAALYEGKSLYAWVLGALRRELARTG